MAKKRAVGEGTVSRRKDGRWEAAIWTVTTAGTRKRIRKYAPTRAAADELLTELKQQIHRGVPIPDKAWRLGSYLDYWLEHVVKPSKQPTTYNQYRWTIGRFLRPGLGQVELSRLSVARVQAYVNQLFKEGQSAHRVRLVRMVLSGALTRAVQEELVLRNVARIVALPSYHPREVHPWSVDEARSFLSAAKSDPLFVAFLIAILYGLRRGEVLGLRWSNVDFDRGILRVRAQIQRVDGHLHAGQVKTAAGNRDLWLTDSVRNLLLELRKQQSTVPRDVERLERLGLPSDLIFTTRSGLPIGPDNFLRSFKRICQANGSRTIRLHDLRHTQATFLMELGVAAKDAQLILGHADAATTAQIYQHSNTARTVDALRKVEQLFTAMPANECTHSRQASRQLLLHEALTNPFTCGAPDRIRTYDLWYRNFAWPWGDHGWCDVRVVLQRRTSTMLLGVVAVNAGRQLRKAPPEARISRTALTPASNLHFARCAPSVRVPLSHWVKA